VTLKRFFGGESLKPPTPPVTVPANHARITVPVEAGSYADGRILLGSKMMAGQYKLVLEGDSPLVNVP
jgi:hypothetical protein